jgi:NADH-quinone oxidoreductase subunit N
MEDLAGLRQRHPILAWMMAASAISLIGMPPLLGFFAKFTIFTAGIEGGQTTLVIIAAVNSAISAYYYLQLVTVPMLGTPNARTEGVHTIPSAWPRYAAVLCGLGVIVLPIGVSSLVKAAAVVGSENAASPTADSSDNQLDERETASAAMISAR